MKPTKVEQLMIDWLQCFPIKEGQRVRIFLMMDTEDQMLDMMTYMSKHRNATGEELMSAAERIAGPLR